MNEKAFTAILALLVNACFKTATPEFVKNGELTPTGKIWFNSLGSLPPDILKAAVEDVINNEEFFPAIATIHKYADKYLNVDELDGSEVWGKVMREMSKVGGMYGEPQCVDDPALLYAIKAIGWRAICTSDESDQPILRAQLRDAYKAAKARLKIKTSPAYLRLVHDTDAIEDKYYDPKK